MAESETTNRILIADDNQQNRELIEAYLAEGDYLIEQAADGQSTIQQVEAFKPDLLLLDIMMPKMSGFEVCQQLKQNPETESIPILVVTALRDSADIEKAVDAGADDFLSKPIHRLELLTRVRSLLKVRHLTNERDRLLNYLREMETPSSS